MGLAAEELAVLPGNVKLTAEEIAALPAYVGVDSPTSYQQAVRYITEGSQGQLARSKKGIEQYRAFKEQVSIKYASVADFIKVTKLNFCSITAEGGKLSAVEVQLDSPRVVWSPNEFPYYLEEGVQHNCIWSTTPLNSAQIEAEIRKHVPGHEYVWFVNPPALSSIPAVWHCHVISRPKHVLAA